MTRWFNVAGPCRTDTHYMVPAISRLPDVMHLIEQQNYFVLHAPRQTGKTTAMLALARELTAQGSYTAALLSVEVGAPFSDSPARAERAILNEWRESARWQLPAELQPPPWPSADEGTQISVALRAWTEASPRPLIVFLDEIDILRDATLTSVLRQIRSGYPRRPTAFPWSIGLIGLRDVRDYKIASGGSERLNTASPFNIKTRSFTLDNFSPAEVAFLYEQHTNDTGQPFASDVIAHAFERTQGQPWLVNALAKVMVEEVAPDPHIPITNTILDTATEIVIRRQDTHLDSLMSILREPRVRSVMEPILAGSSLADISADDRQFVVDLGLVRRDAMDGMVIANPIYREIIPRALASGPADSLPSIHPTWLTSDGQLDPERLLNTFMNFWRQHGEVLLASAPYAEIAPHLVMMAFLHRVANGGGTIEREYAIGRDRMDLCLRYGAVILGIEIKTWRDGRADPLNDGIEQLDGYLARLGIATGWLVIFDQRSNVQPIAQRTRSAPAQTQSGRTITVVWG